MYMVRLMPAPHPAVHNVLVRKPRKALHKNKRAHNKQQSYDNFHKSVLIAKIVTYKQQFRFFCWKKLQSLPRLAGLILFLFADELTVEYKLPTNTTCLICPQGSIFDFLLLVCSRSMIESFYWHSDCSHLIFTSHNPTFQFRTNRHQLGTLPLLPAYSSGSTRAFFSLLPLLSRYRTAYEPWRYAAHLQDHPTQYVKYSSGIEFCRLLIRQHSPLYSDLCTSDRFFHLFVYADR